MHSHVDIQKSVGLSVCSSANYRGLVWLWHTRTRTCSSFSTIGLSWAAWYCCELLKCMQVDLTSLRYICACRNVLIHLYQ